MYIHFVFPFSKYLKGSKNVFVYFNNYHMFI